MKSANITVETKARSVRPFIETNRMLTTAWPVINMAKGQSKKENSLQDKTLEMYRRYREQNLKNEFNEDLYTKERRTRTDWSTRDRYLLAEPQTNLLPLHGDLKKLEVLYLFPMLTISLKFF